MNDREDHRQAGNIPQVEEKKKVRFCDVVYAGEEMKGVGSRMIQRLWTWVEGWTMQLSLLSDKSWLEQVRL